ncbi:MAG: transcription antitermination factor NusB [Endomicrobiales bacterium]|nr:transcription antitermination factor NusB [Endomicrobiales bacterium]
MSEDKKILPSNKLKKVGNRRLAREATLQMLYLCDNCKFSPEEAEKTYWTSFEMTDKIYSFSKELFNGILDKKTVLDQLIAQYTKNWKMERMATIDRNILRLAAFEIINTPETPISVIIDEAVEIAKRYSTQDSGKFVNGILDKLKSERKTNP